MTFQDKSGPKKKFQTDFYEQPVKEYHDPWLSEDHAMDQVDDFGFEKQESDNVELFQFKNFDVPDFPKNEQIKQLAIAGRMFLIISKSNRIFRWRPEKESGCLEMDLPDSASVGSGQKLFSVGSALISTLKSPFFDKDKKDNVIIERVFMDPKGFHAIFCSDSGDNFYISYKDSKIRYISGVRGKIIKSIAWNDSCTEEATKDILIGTKDGKILLTHFELKGIEFQEREVKPMVSVPNERQINQLEYFSLNLEAAKFSCIIASTNFSIFFFFGANELEIAFSKYKESGAVMRAESIPVRSHTSLMSVCYAKGKANSFLFTNGKTLNLFKLPEKNQPLNDQFSNQSVYLKYAKREDLDEKRAYEVQEMPLAVALSEFHYFLLHSDCLTVISRVTEKVVKYYDSQLRQMGHLLDMIYDQESEELWIYSDRAVCKLVIANEDKDVWKLLMEKKKYMEAYDIGRKYKSDFTDYIAGLCGDQLYQKKDYIEAASYYLKSSKSFEEIFLIFITSDDPGARIGLEIYLKRLLDKLKNQERTLVLSWLTELYIYRLNWQERLFQESRSSFDHESQRQKDLKEKQQQLKELTVELDSFLQKYNNELEKDIVYQIMQSHGRIQNCVEFAKQNQNYDMIILHHINEENYKEAIKNLKNVQDKNSMEVIQKYSYILMKQEPEETLQLLISHIKKFDPTKIIGGLMNIPEEKRKCGIKFLEHSIKNLDFKDKSIHNILIFFLTKPADLTKLQNYLNEQERFLLEKEKVNFDLDFALRLFSGSNLIEPQITIYGMMGLYTESVQLALQNNLIEKAKEYARRAEDDDKKKKLWMLIAIHLLSKNLENIDDVIELTKQTDLIKIEDLLPHFNENIKIEHFKDEICNSLKNYNEEIEKLKEEMKKFSQNSEQLKNELKMIKNKFLIIDTQQKCENCFKHLFNDAFYLFPCNHGFHKVNKSFNLNQECIVEKMKSSPLDPIKLQEIDRLNSVMSQIISKSNQNAQRSQNPQQGGAFLTLMNIFGAGKSEIKQQAFISNEEGELLKKTKEKFDQAVASECVLCGPSIVDSVQLAFELNQSEKDSWNL